MNTYKSEFGRRRMVGRIALKEFVSLQDKLRASWERCIREEAMDKIDWEQRTWDAAVAIMAAFQIRSNEGGNRDALMAIDAAKALVAEYRRGE